MHTQEFAGEIECVRTKRHAVYIYIQRNLSATQVNVNQSMNNNNACKEFGLNSLIEIIHLLSL